MQADRQNDQTAGLQDVLPVHAESVAIDLSRKIEYEVREPRGMANRDG